MRRRKRGSLLSRIVRPELLWRILCYGLLIFVLASAECSFFAVLRFLPATPDLLLGAVVAVSLLDQRRASLVFAMAAGLLLGTVESLEADENTRMLVATVRPAVDFSDRNALRRVMIIRGYGTEG